MIKATINGFAVSVPAGTTILEAARGVHTKVPTLCKHDDLDPTGAHCLAKPDCCDTPCAANRSCYRAQCFATARVLRAALELDEANSSVVFQSRLGRSRWLEPDLVNLLPDLAARGIRRPAVLCPAFVADCLETVEEVGIRAREQWSELGGEALCLVPCVNAEPAWAQGVARLVEEAIA
ncbi:MAG: hypothetical protein GY944_06170 [bacterium]|nr:hypothetical protein [bacterium]